MNNKIIQLGRCVLIILLSGLTVQATAQVNTIKVANNTKSTTTNQTTDLKTPEGIVIAVQFVIEDDIMQSKDGENGNNNGIKNDDDIDVSSANTSDVKNTNFSTSTLNQLAQEIKIYPTPANTFTNIDLGQVKIKGLDVINSLGQKVHSQTTEQQFVRLNVSNYQTGIYFIQMKTAGNQVLTKSIMVN